MHAPHSPSSSFKPSHLAKASILIATLLPKTYAATHSSSANEWLYPDVYTVPTYNFLDTVNASWTSDFVAPYLLLRCQHPDDTAHYAYPYNQSIPATGSSLVPLDDGNAWTCHFQVVDLHDFSANPPTFSSSDFNIVLNNGRKPVLWTDSKSSGETGTTSAIANFTPSSPTSSIRSSKSTSSPTTTTPTSPTSTSTSSPSPPTTPPIPEFTPPSTPSSSPTPTNSLSKSQKVAIIVASTMGALFLLILAVAILFILRVRRSVRNTGVVYRRSGAGGNGDVYGGGGGGGGKEDDEVPGLEAPRERWKGVELQHDHGMQGYF